MTNDRQKEYQVGKILKKNVTTSAVVQYVLRGRRNSQKSVLGSPAASSSFAVVKCVNAISKNAAKKMHTMTSEKISMVQTLPSVSIV